MTEMFQKKKTQVIRLFIESDSEDLRIFLNEKGFGDLFSDKEVIDYNEQKELILKVRNQKQKTKNQHYVQQFYLKIFTNNQGRLETLDMKNNKIIGSQNAKKVCSESYFYSIQKGQYDDLSQILENYFKRFEDDFVSIYDRLHEDILQYKEIHSDILYRFCVYISLTMSRTKRFRKQLEDQNEQIMKQMSQIRYKMQKHHNPSDKSIKKISENPETEKMFLDGDYSIEFQNNQMHIERVSDQKNIFGFANLLFNKKIRFYISDGSRGFVTSDNPVFELQPEIRSIYGYTFMQRYHYFALSEKILVEFSDPNAPGKPIKRKRINKGEIMYFNLLRSMYSQYMYSSNKKNFCIDDYSEVRMNNIDRLYNLFPTRFGEEKELTDDLREQARKAGFNIKSNYELYKLFKKHLGSDS